MTDKVKDDGGSVHPQLITTIHADKAYVEAYSGITRRDDLAKAAMQGLMGADYETRRDQDKEARNRNIPTGQLIAELAYLVADAMIAKGRENDQTG